MTHHLTREQARRLVVRAQLLDAERPGDVVEVAEQLGYVKIDPTAVIAPCEHTVLWSRIGWSYEAGQLQKAVEIDRLLFEFDGMFRPMSMLPLLRPAMRRSPERAGDRDWLDANARFRADVLARLRANGPLPTTAFADTSRVQRAPDGWSSKSQVPAMLDLLLRRGEVAVSRREGRTRVWDLAERVYPSALWNGPVGDGAHAADEASEAARLLAVRALAASGIARPHRYWSGVAADTGEPATVEGSSVRWRVDPQALARLDDDPGGRVAFLNPYDSMLFDRRRLQELFEFTYVLEQFTPRAQRVYGTFAHPILLGDRFVGMLDAELDRRSSADQPGASEGVLRLHAVHEFAPLDAEERDAIRAEVDELGEWLGVPVDDRSG